MVNATKEDLIASVAAKALITKVDAARAVDAVINSIQEYAVSNTRLDLRELGIFDTTERAAHVGRNPKTGEQVEIPATRVLKFKTGAKLRRMLNEA